MNKSIKELETQIEQKNKHILELDQNYLPQKEKLTQSTFRNQLDQDTIIKLQQQVEEIQKQLQEKDKVVDQKQSEIKKIR